MDYPLSFKGILYFPKINNEFDSLEGQVKLYYNQVFVADNIKEVIPEYFLMLKGVLDCPELPLNVSRSYLQNSGYVTKISAHIVKKTADKLCGMFNTDRPSYEKIWKDLKVFMEYGCLKDKKFYDRVKDVLLYELTDGSFVTLKEYKESVKDKQEGKICYCTDKTAQAQYIGLYEAQGVKVALLDRVLDSQFIQMIENLENVKFFRVDAELTEALKGEGEAEKDDSLEKILREVSGNEELSVRFAPLKDETGAGCSECFGRRPSDEGHDENVRHGLSRHEGQGNAGRQFRLSADQKTPFLHRRGKEKVRRRAIVLSDTAQSASPYGRRNEDFPSKELPVCGRGASGNAR